MTLHVDNKDSHNYTCLLDGKDISHICRYADEEHGVAYCLVKRTNGRGFIVALTNELPIEWAEENPTDTMILYELRGKVEIKRRD